MQVSTIVVGADFSEKSRAAVEQARNIACPTAAGWCARTPYSDPGAPGAQQ